MKLLNGKQYPNRQALLLLLVGTLLLCSVPAICALTGWQWQPGQSPWFAQFFHLVSLSANPLITLLIFALVLRRLKLTKRQNLILLLTIGAIMFSSLVFKNQIKNSLQESRPFAVWLKQNNISTKTNKDPAANFKPKRFIAQEKISALDIPEWQQKYWANSSKYSFPSGHSLFAALMALITLTLLWQIQAYGMIILVMLWAGLVEVSRLVLGMHWPHDIFASCLIAAVFVALGNYAWNRWIFFTTNNTSEKTQPALQRLPH